MIHTSALTGAALFVLAFTASAQNVAQMMKEGGNLVIMANDVRFNRGGTHGQGDIDTIQGWLGEMTEMESSFNLALSTFKVDSKEQITDALKVNKETISTFNTEAEESLADNAKTLKEAMASLDGTLSDETDSFEDKVDALKAAIEDKLAEYEALADTIPGKIQAITKVLKVSKDKAAEDTNAFKSSLGPQVAVVTKVLSQKKSDTKAVWAGGTTRSAGGGWGWLGLDRTDLDASGQYFTASGDTFSIKKDGLYRMNYQGIQRGGNCNGYALVQMNGKWVSAHHYNKHISGWNTYNPQNVDFTWKLEQGDRLKLYLYDCRTRIYGSRQGRLDSYNRVSFSFEGENEASMIAKG